MVLYEIVETDAGWMVAELEPGKLPEDAALRHGGVVVDPGPYKTYEEAYDAVLALEAEEDDE